MVSIENVFKGGGSQDLARVGRAAVEPRNLLDYGDQKEKDQN